MSFDWHTEDEAWDDNPPEIRPVQRRRRLRWLPIIIVSIVAFMVGGLAIYRQVDGRLDSVAADVEDDVLSSDKVVRLAAAQQDEELFVTVLSGRDQRWADVHRDLVRSGTLLDRSALGMQHEQDQETDLVQITLSPDLTEAVMVTNERFAIDVGNSVTDTVLLERRVVYRLGPEQWLLAPAISDESGPWVANEGRYLTVIVTEAELALAKRLAHDLERKVAELCAILPDQRCGADLHLTVRLDSDPESLLLDDSWGGISAAEREIRLPAPSLVGVPIDEAGYQALFRGYGSLVIGRAFLQALDGQCCEHAAFSSAIVNQILADLALRPGAVPADVYDRYLAHPVDLASFRNLWAEDNVDPARDDVLAAGAVIEFLLATAPELRVGELAASLNEESSYWSWVTRHLSGDLATEDIEREWLAFIYSRSSSADAPLPVPLPGQDVMLLCGPGSRSENASLFRYVPETDTWTEELADRRFSSLVPLPDGDGVLLVETAWQEPGTPPIRLTRWQRDVAETVWESTSSQLLYFYDLLDPSGEWYFVSGEDLSAGQYVLQSFPLRACSTAATCEPLVLEGVSVFAPDGQHALVVRPAFVEQRQTDLLLTDNVGEEQHRFMSSANPFWIDDNKFGFVRLSELGDGAEIMIGDLEDIEAESMLSVSDLALMEPELFGSSPEELRFESIAIHGSHQDQLFFVVGQEAGASDDLFVLDLQSGQATHLLELSSASATWPSLGFSPDGDWLMLTEFLSDVKTGEILLYRVGDGQVMRLPLLEGSYGISWTAEGIWLVKADGEWLTLIAPDYDYQRVIVHEHVGCDSAGWVTSDR